MRALVLIPPMVPSYFNAGHHLIAFQAAAYLREQEGVSRVECIDAAALNVTWRDICAQLSQPWDLLAVVNDFDSIDGIPRLLEYARELCPSARTATVGRLSHLIPGFFERLGVDAIVASGDYDAGLAIAARALAENRSAAPGVRLRDAAGRYSDGGPGVLLEPDEWVLPDAAEIPYAAYDRLYENDARKFCGIPDRRELVVPVARGCPVGCSFCDVPMVQGKRERRLPVDRVVAYISDCFARHPFEYVSFYAPTFTLKRAWVEELASALSSLRRPIAWKCATTLKHLTASLIDTMARSGCVRISVGIETFGRRAQRHLPVIKQAASEEFLQLAAACRSSGVELNCFVMVGVPDDDPASVAITMDTVRAAGARVRPTAYTPYHLLRDDMTPLEVSRFNRQLFVGLDLDPAVRREFYRLLYPMTPDRPTAVMQHIARRTA